jgi:hypothetical protein
MKFLFRWAFRLLILTLVLGIGALLLKDIILREITVKRLRAETGMDVRIGKMSVGLLNSEVSFENLVFYNTAEFGGAPLFEIPDLHIEYDREGMVHQKFQFKLLRINFREINVVENQQGKNNMQEFLHRLRATPSTSKPAQRAGGGDAWKFDRIDLLNLSAGKVRYTNMRFPKRNQESDVGIRNEMIPNLRTPEDLAGVLLKVLLRAGITVYLDQHTTNRARSLL